MDKENCLTIEKGEIDDFRTGMTAFLASIPYTMRRKENERERKDISTIHSIL